MKSLIFKLIASLITFAIGVAMSMIWLFQSTPSNSDHPPARIAAPSSIQDISSSEASTEVTRELPDTLDPYSIKQYIDENHSIDAGLLWQELEIGSEMQTVYPRIGFKPEEIESVLFESCESCSAEIFKLELDGDPGKEVLLKIYENLGLTRYLIFQSRKIGESVSWKLLGHADHDFARYYNPQHRVQNFGGKKWLVVTCQGISGTGVSLDYDRWYEVDGHGVREALSLSAEGHQSTASGYPERKFASRVVNYQRDKTGEKFTVEYSIKQQVYIGSEDQRIKFKDRKQAAVYIRRPHADKFELYQRFSEITPDEIKTAYNIDTFSSEDFIKFNFASLEKIARYGRQAHKEWLRGFLQDCEDTPETISLNLILNSN